MGLPTVRTQLRRRERSQRDCALFLAFADPLLGPHPFDLDRLVFRTNLRIAASIWNAVVSDTLHGTDARIERIRAVLTDLGEPEGGRMWALVEQLRRRKLDMFPDETVYIDVLGITEDEAGDATLHIRTRRLIRRGEG